MFSLETETAGGRLRYLLAQLLFVLALGVPAAAGACIGAALHPAPIMWALGALAGIACSLLGLWLLQPLLSPGRRG